MQRQIVRGTAGRYRAVNDLGVKKGPFYVLFLSNMPAILVEAGFLTNRGEAARLRDVDYLDELAEQIARGAARAIATTSAARRAGRRAVNAGPRSTPFLPPRSSWRLGATPASTCPRRAPVPAATSRAYLRELHASGRRRRAS